MAASDIDDDDLKSVARTLVSQPDVDVDDRDRFFSQVQALAEARARNSWPSEGDQTISVFVNADYPRNAASALGDAAPCADLIGTTEPLLGQIFLLDRNASQGWKAELPYDDPGQIVEWLSSQPFGTSQVVILYRQSLLLVDRADGAANGMTRREEIRTGQPSASKSNLIDALNLFHLREVLTPKGCPEGVWRPKAAHLYHAGATPETSIQARLKTFLNGWFRGLLRAEVEDSTEIGRIDIRLLTPDGVSGGLTYWGIIELKVIKTYRHSKTGGVPVKVAPIQNARDIAKGVEQAHAFAKNRGCACSVLEIFDMRQDKAVDLRSHGEVEKVKALYSPLPDMRLTPIFGSASDARKAGIIPPP